MQPETTNFFRLYAQRDARACILVITDDFENLVELRVRIPFDAMYKTGLIKGYHVLHRGKLVRSVGIPAEIEQIDVVWVQRAVARSLLFLIDVLDEQFVYDIDDHLLVSPGYQTAFSHTTTGVVLALLSAAKVVSTTNVTLLNNLQLRSNIRLEEKSFLAPNVAEEISMLPRKPMPEMLLLSISGRLPLTTSHSSFVRGVKRFIQRRKMPIFYIGTNANDFTSFGQTVGATGLLDYFTYRAIIRRQNVMAIVPLEGRGDAPTQEFVESKSDVKMVEFGSCGVPALYADVVPYRETPLRCGPLADMGDDRAIEDALDHVFDTSLTIRAAAEKSVQEHRLAVSCVPTTWFRAVEAGQLSEPYRLDDLLKREAGYAALSLTPEAQLAVLQGRRRSHSVYAKAKEVSGNLPHDLESQIHLPLVNVKDRSRGIKRSSQQKYPPLFDSEFYLRTYPDVEASGQDPYEHYLKHGIIERRNPNPFFDTYWYINKHPESEFNGMDPLEHYLMVSADRDVDPSPRFCSQLYKLLNPGIGNTNPLLHYLKIMKQS